ncbi:hypothetical protein [Shewanella algicola]|uniref:Uncharacterized protein n=1 Tax=Shewanella algicola TaxID=640633 RepID=A0A9X2CCE0_9GAMM|nr:hypothetical protein [Shewanella algicola]MCL1107784.1 hypothetical protein [Shewanella algicola]GGP73003.1 hypothetical protein GCM10009347_41910 [Shewanella algicola]
MRVFVGQIYIQAGVNYPFSHEFQKWVGDELSRLIEPSDAFIEKYSEEFELMFRLSAKAELDEIEIKGPTVFKKDKDIEFTIFLPYQRISLEEKDSFIEPIKLFLEGVALALEVLSINSSMVRSNSSELVEKIISNGSMFKG